MGKLVELTVVNCGTVTEQMVVNRAYYGLKSTFFFILRKSFQMLGCLS